MAPYQEIVASLKAEWAPDKRVARFAPTIVWNEEKDCVILSGTTNLPGAAAQLRTRLQAADLCFTDSLQQLPVSHFGADTLGLVKVSVANLRSQPKHSAELATQALMGMPLIVYDQQDNWYLVQTPDGYLAWLDVGAFVRMDQAGLDEFMAGRLGVVATPLAQVMDQPVRGKAIRDLSMGNILQLAEQSGGMTRVVLPDGASGYFASDAVIAFEDWQSKQTNLQISQLAQSFYGAPYLWGGTSAKGMDCSGFTKMAYWMNGFVIPRDASQQVHAGTEVPIDDDLSQLAPQDLLFFGTLREDGSQRVTHVGIYLGDGRFVHSGADNGFIMEQSLFPGTKDYADHRRKSLLRVKRLSVGSPGVKAFRRE
ncbi:MAG: C40 family peptidase [Bacteroidota bacterium]